MTNPNRPIRCGAVGVGRMGRHHARVYAELAAAHPDRFEMVGVVDANPETAARVAEQHNTTAFATEKELLEAGVDAVSIAVPTTFHYKSAEPFLSNGVACLIEKPLAPSAEEANRIKTLAEQTGACL
ncbi:MAG: Gfo/Idh/MocA family oxidoreductase, partial [Planctomycetota bacterium]